MCRKPAQKLAIKFPIMRHTQGLASVPFFVHCNEHGELLVRVASDKLFHMLQHLLSAWGFARSLRETPLQRFHSIINASNSVWLGCAGRDSFRNAAISRRLSRPPYPSLKYSRYNRTQYVPGRWHSPGTLRDRGAARGGRHGRGVPRSG